VSAEEMQEAVTEARALICSALADLGGVCERLREIESGPPAYGPESWDDVASWTEQACETLGMVTSIAAKMDKEGSK
jgi:hypothetical protein